MDSGEITRLLQAANDGNEGALDDLMSKVYTDLRRIADKHMRRQFGQNMGGVTLQPTALVNEAFFRLIKQRKGFGNRGQFFSIATKVLIRVLTDYQRSRGREKRAGDQVRVELSGIGLAAAVEPSADIVDLSNALDQLEQLDARKAEVVKLRALWGMTVPEIAETVGASVATVERDWSFSKRWLAARLTEDGEDPLTDTERR